MFFSLRELGLMWLSCLTVHRVTLCRLETVYIVVTPHIELLLISNEHSQTVFLFKDFQK